LWGRGQSTSGGYFQAPVATCLFNRLISNGVVVDAVPGEPRRIRADVVNSTAVRVQWRTPDTTSQNDEHTLTSTLSGVIRGYRVYISVDGADPSSPPAAPRDIANPEATELVVGGLVPDTTYLVHATAYTRRADGQPSRTVKVRTKGAGIFSAFNNDDKTPLVVKIPRAKYNNKSNNINRTLFCNNTD